MMRLTAPLLEDVRLILVVADVQKWSDGLDIDQIKKNIKERGWLFLLLCYMTITVTLTK